MTEPLQPLVDLPLGPDVRVCWEKERGGAGSEWREGGKAMIVGRVMVEGSG